MKKTSLTLILTLLILCLTCQTVTAYSKEYKPEENINDLGTKYEYKKAYCLVDGLMIEYDSFNRGDKVLIQDEDDEYYYINDDSRIIAIEKEYIRTENEEMFESFDAYATSGAKVYSDIDLSSKVSTLSLNDKIKVVDKVLNIYLVMYNGQIAYMNTNSLSKNQIKIYIAPKVETPSNDYSYSGSSGGGGSDEGGGNTGGGGEANNPDPAPPSGAGADGEEIELACNGQESKIEFLTATNLVKGVILLDETESYIAILKRNDEIKVLKQDGDNYRVSFLGYTTDIPTKYVRLEKDSEPGVKEYYAKSNVRVYSDFSFNTIINTLKVNTIVKIIDEIDDYYIIELENGTFGYIKKENVSETKIKIIQYVAPKVETPTYDYSSSGSGGSDNTTPAPSVPTPAPSEPDPTPSEPNPIQQDDPNSGWGNDYF